MSLLNKVAAVTTAVVQVSGRVAKDVANEAKLYTRLAELKDSRDKLFFELGKATFAGDFEGIDKLTEKISFISDEIAELDTQLLKPDKVNPDPEQPDQPVQDDAEESEVVQDDSEVEIGNDDLE